MYLLRFILNVFNINYKVVNVLKLTLFNFLVFAREDKIIIFRIFNKINQILGELFLILLFYLICSLIFIIFLLYC